MSYHRLLVVAIATILLNSGQAGSAALPAAETIYAQSFPDGRRLIVEKIEIPKEKALEDKNGNPIPRDPNAQYPEHLYEYSFTVQSADRTSQVAVGKMRMGTLSDDVERMAFTVLDAFVFDDQLVVLYKSHRATCADTAFIGPKGTGFLLAGTRPLITDAKVSGYWAIGGRLEQTPKTADLHAFVTVHYATRVGDERFLLVNKDGKFAWVPDPYPSDKAK